MSTNQNTNATGSANTPPVAPPQSKPNEVGGIYYSSHIKIVDPQSGEVLLQMRGDL